MSFALVSCGDEDIPDGMQLASGENVPYKLFAPLSWVCDLNDDLSMAYYSAADTSNVQVTSYPGSSIEEYWKTCCEDYEKTFEEFVYDAEKGTATVLLGEKDAKSYTYTVKLAGKEYKIKQVVTVRDGMIYSLTYTSSPEKFDSHLTDVDAMFKNFKFR